jgi:hypothetical protein
MSSSIEYDEKKSASQCAKSSDWREVPQPRLRQLLAQVADCELQQVERGEEKDYFVLACDAEFIS